MLKRDLDVRCMWCGKDSHLGTWNDETYAQCTNREMKRAFTQLTDKRAFLKKSDTFYKCPACGKWSRGCELQIVHTTDKFLLSLGREQSIKFSKEDTDKPE